jgi:uncharacterized protein (UPF0305 family)
MNSCELFLLLKKDAENISAENVTESNANAQEHIMCPPESIEHRIQAVVKYDLEIFSEIKSRNCVSVAENIDLTKLEDFNFQINQYMDENAPNQPDFKQYIRIICTYLAFIAKKPLHPLGMTFSNNQKIVSKGNNYYCPERGKNTQETTSLCRYCICKPIVALPLDGGIK